ncbi:MAG TPA: CpXC domain-containing protein, partial [Aggregatilineales bacterium]|nr:CpXC domain-containing protein [Aggregatilineales bacterium]
MNPRGVPQVQVKCPNCGQPFATSLEQVIDGGRDPNGKARLLSGRVNVAQCPACGVDFRLSTPLLYHDARKELLITYIPMELGMPRDEQERLIGQMQQAITQSLPQEQRKGYLLMPKNALTLQGMLDTILEADGITKEVLEARRAKLALAEQFLQAPEDNFDALVQEHDDALDEEFFMMLTASGEAALAGGRQDVAGQILGLRQKLLERATIGQTLLANAKQQEQVIAEVGAILDTLGGTPTRDDIVNVLIRVGQEKGLEALPIAISMMRPALDYNVFMLLARRIEEAPDAEKAALTEIRDLAVRITQEIDQQSQQVAGQAVQVLQAIVDSDDLDAALEQYAEVIDDTFLAVLTANMDNAAQRGNQAALAKLEAIYGRIMDMMQENAPPPLRLINEAMRAPDLPTAEGIIRARAAEFGTELPDLFEVLIAELMPQGETPVLERLRALKAAAVSALNGGTGGASAMPLSGDQGEETSKGGI